MAETGKQSESARLAETTTSGRLIQLDAGESGRLAGVSTRRRRRTRMPGLAVLPSMLTLGNSLCGVAGIIELFKAFAATAAFHDTGNITSANEALLRLAYACLFIGGGLVFDGLDGKVARLTDSTGRFGAELDSLSDVITFGVLPAVLIRAGGEFFFVGAGYAIDTKILWSISAIYCACAILRLARFNVETQDHDEHNTFQGLPSPAAAGSIAGLVLGPSWLCEHFNLYHDPTFEWILRIAIPLIGLFIGLMMITRIRYVHIFNKLVSRQRSLKTLVLLMLFLATVLATLKFWKLWVPAVTLTYVASGPVYLGYRFVRGRGLLGRGMAIAERKHKRQEAREKSKKASKSKPSQGGEGNHGG